MLGTLKTVGYRRSEIFELNDRGNLVGVMPEPEPPQLEQIGAGYGYPVTRHHPRTCPSFLPRTLPLDVDLDGDDRHDARVIVEVSIADVNQNGTPDEGDIVCLEPKSVQIIGIGVRLVLSEEMNKAWCQRIANGL